MRHIATAFLISALFVSSAANAKGPFGAIRVGSWSGGAFTDDATGQFSSCIASAQYKSGINVGVVVTSGYAWGLGFLRQNWRMQVGQTFPIILTFDGKSPFNVTGRAIAYNHVLVPMPDNSELITQFRKARRMSAFAQGQLFQFDLDDTSILIPSLVNCVRSVNARGIAAAGDFTIQRSQKLVVETKPAVPAGSSLSPENAPAVPPEYQVEAIEIASNFLIRSQLQNPLVVPRAETPIELASYGAAWKSDEALGFVRIIPAPGDVKGLDVAATVIGNDAKACKGTFASGRMSELVDSDVVFRGVAKCDDSDGSRVAQYFIIPRKKGGFVMISVQSNMKTEQARTVTKDERLVDFKKAALVAVSQ